MKQSIRDKLTEGGMNVEATLGRFGDDEELFLKYLSCYVNDPTFHELEQALESGDEEAIFHTCHTLKGVSGNLGLEPLYRAASAMMDCLRANDEQAARKRFAAVRKEQEAAVANLRSLG